MCSVKMKGLCALNLLLTWSLLWETHSLSGFPEVAFPDMNTGRPVAILRERVLPPSFQYNLSCTGSMIDYNHMPLIPSTLDNSDGYCRDLINLGRIDVQTSNTNPRKVSVPLNQMPLQQTFENREIVATRIGIKGSHLTSCCDQTQCPETCLRVPNSQVCWLMVYAPGHKTVASTDYSLNDWNWVPFVNNLPQTGVTTTTEEVALVPIFEISCQACVMKDCKTTCANGEYASSYSIYREVSHILLFSLLMVT
jgi:hypothetical protein